MGITTIVLGGSSVSLVALPASPGFRTLEFEFNESVAVSKSVFTGQVQTQRWPGADYLSGTFSLPPLTQAQADEWISALMLLRGPLNAFQIGDPLKKSPRGNPKGAPVVNGVVTATSNSITTRGWQASRIGVLQPGDYVQVGYRLYRSLVRVDTDASGDATFPVFPSVREDMADGVTIGLSKTKGLFRLVNNQNKWSTDYTRLSALSCQFVEYR